MTDPVRGDKTPITGDPIREAALAAMKEHGFDPNAEKLFDEGESPEAEEVQDDDLDEDDEELEDSEAPEEVDGDLEDDEDEDETALEAEDVPTEYFGEDLSDLTPEQRQRVIAALESRDAEIQRAKREAAQARQGRGEEEEEVELPEEFSDEDLMKALGYDPEDPLYEVMSTTALPIAKQLLETRQAVATLLEEREVERFEGFWNSTIDQLERDHEIEVDREELLEFAIENKVPDPVDAYSRFVLRGKKAVSEEAKKARLEAQEKVRARKKAAATQRPQGGRTKPKAPARNLTPEEAAKMAAKELGMDWNLALAQVHD